MIYLQLSSVAKSFNNLPILQDIDLTVQKGDRIGLVGANGTGKTTILRIVQGEMHPDSGQISTARDIKIGYVSQEDEISSDYTLFLSMLESFTDLLKTKSEMDQLEPRLVDGTPQDLARYGELQQQWEHLGGYSYEADIKNALIGLGFTENDLYRPVNSFSGGEKNRAALARVLVHSPDLLLLDEPTNHLDIESTIWLEQYLASFEGAVVAVSHDRVFLDHLVTRIVELEDGVLDLYPGNFSNYWQERAERRNQKLKKYLEQKEEIERIEDFIRRNIAGQKTRQAQSRRHALTKVERLETPVSDPKRPALRIEVSRRSYLATLQLRDVSFGYDDQTLFSDTTFTIERGEKVGLIGRNGSGKSTLVKLIVGELKTPAGEVVVGRNVDIEYFDQELSGLEPEQTVLDTIWDIRPDLEAYGLRSYLARFLFFGEEVFKEVRMLSGGEKKKLALARLLAFPANFLILDEPTNHLDIGSLEALQTALREYDGTLLFISHDRHFLDQVADRVLAIEDGGLTDTPGNYTEYVARHSARAETPRSPLKLQKKQDYRLEKREKNLRSARRKRIKELERLIPEQEAAIQSLQRRLLNEEIAADWELLEQLQQEKRNAEADFDKLMTEYYQLVEADEADDS